MLIETGWDKISGKYYVGDAEGDTKEIFSDWKLLAAAFLIFPFVEEVFFRCLPLQLLPKLLPRIKAGLTLNVAQALLFGAAHIYGRPYNSVGSVASTSFVGFMLGRLFLQGLGSGYRQAPLFALGSSYLCHITFNCMLFGEALYQGFLNRVGLL